jgi:ABC-type uncharacterized transport system permease subunit
VLLAYAHGRRGRILPDEYRDVVYSRINLQVRPTLLVDGLVAGTWSVEKKRREAVLTLRLLRPLRPAVWSSLVEEAERLVRFCQPDAATYQVTAAAE